MAMATTAADIGHNENEKTREIKHQLERQPVYASAGVCDLRCFSDFN